MSQHDFDIANQSASNARSDINNALKALASLSSGSTAPSTTYANMLWYDTGNNTLKMRAEADDAWISIGYLDQSTDTFALFDDTKVVDSSGTQTGILGDQAEALWEAGTGTTESLVSPAKIKAAIEALTSSDIPDGSVTQAKLDTSQATYSGSLGNGGSVVIQTPNSYSFFPEWSNNSDLTVGFNVSSDALRISNNSGGTRSYSVTWRYVNS